MMIRLFDRAMSFYGQSEYTLQMKARFLFGFCLINIIILCISGINSLYLLYASDTPGLGFQVIYVIISCLFVMLCTLVLLVQGWFVLSAHLIILTMLMTVWAVMILDPSDTIMRLDSIVHCIVLLSMLPLVITRHRSAIFLYGTLNIFFLSGFIYFNWAQLPISNIAKMDYLNDNIIATIGVCTLSYFIYSINQSALHRASMEIQERKLAEAIIKSQKDELEVANQELSLAFQRMDVTTREIEEANVHLKEAHTEILTANTLLQESEERFSKAFHLNPLMTGLITHGEGLFVDVSDNFCFTTGYAREEIIGRTPLELNIMENPSDLEEIINIIATDKKIVDKELLMRSRSGKLHSVLISAGLVYIAQVPHTIIVGIDITLRKQAEKDKAQLEAQLRQAQKMESIGRLAGGVAHDFNNLLTAISGNTSLVMMDMPEDNPLYPRLAGVIKAADSAANLTRQLLAFSRKQFIEPRPVDLSELLGNMHGMLTRLISEDIRLEIANQSELGIIKVDPGQIEQIIVNLVVNARDAMPDGGRLVMETYKYTISDEYADRHPYTMPGVYVVLAISDTGCGMTLEVKQHLFEPFFTTKPLGKGTGLGLATIYGAVKQNGGSIEVYSEPGQGTTFKIYFPIIEGKVTSPIVPATGKDLPTGSETILLVEDDPRVLDFGQSILKRLGYTVLTAKNGEEALEIASQYPQIIHLLLTDVILTGINGRTLADQVFLVRPYLRVLFTSGYTENIIAHHGVLEEGIDFLGKPYTIHSIAKKIREVLEKEA